MNRMIGTRLRRLEEACPDRRKRLFVLDGATEAERQAEIDGLIASGEARDSDWFVVTGVTRSPGAPCGAHGYSVSVSSARLTVPHHFALSTSSRK